jgi:hypothetical protein
MAKNQLTEKEVVELLQSVLSKTMEDTHLAQKILDGIRGEMERKKQAQAFQEFCRRCPLPNLEDGTLKEVTQRFEETFGRDLIDFVVDEKDNTLTVELNVPNGPLVSSIEINDLPLHEQEMEPEVKVKYVPFPVALPGDPELVWTLAKRETMTPDEAARALHEAQVEFWESKSGQLQLRKGAERIFSEFILRVPAKFLTELGLKRHYKDPEPVKVLRKSIPG